MVNPNDINLEEKRCCSKYMIIIGILIAIIVIQFVASFIYGVILHKHDDEIGDHKHTSSGILQPSASEI